VRLSGRCAANFGSANLTHHSIPPKTLHVHLKLAFGAAFIVVASAFAQQQTPPSPTPKPPKPAPEAGGRGTVEFWEKELRGKTKSQIKTEMGTPAAIKDKGAIYVYKEEFFHPDLDKWRDLHIQFSTIDEFAESFTGSGGDTQIYPISAPMADEVAPPTPTPTPQIKIDLEELKRKVEQSVVTIEYSEHSEQWEGAGATGFLVEYNGAKYVASNIHVLEGEAETQVQLAWHHGTRPGPAGNPRLVQKSRLRSSFDQFVQETMASVPMPSARTLDGKAVGLRGNFLLSSARDVVLIPAVTDAPPLEISEKAPARDANCVIVGNPAAANTLLALEGEVSNVGPDRLEVSRLRGGALQPGMSGSPVVDAKTSKVLAIVAYKTTRTKWIRDDVVPGATGAAVVPIFELEKRDFAYRLDNVEDLQPFTWAAFVRDAVMFAALKERTMNVYWASRAYSVIKSNDEQLTLTPDFDNSVAVAYESFVRDLRQVLGTSSRNVDGKRLFGIWQSYQRRLEMALYSDLNENKYRVYTPWFDNLVTTTLASERRSVAAELRKQAGLIQSANASR